MWLINIKVLFCILRKWLVDFIDNLCWGVFNLEVFEFFGFD